MVDSPFESLLKELAKSLDIETLTPDENNSCLIRFEDETEVQIEPLESGNFLLLMVDLGEIPPGRYRERVFREALKFNGLPAPRTGVFCFSEQSGHLLLHKLLPIQDLTGEKIASFLIPFRVKAKKWKESLDNNEVPTITLMQNTSSGSGMFGMR